MNWGMGFDNDRYLKEQKPAIWERVERFNHKPYLEFGGKLLFDYHAARVLPGYDPNVKIRLLSELKDKADLLLCIYAGDVDRQPIAKNQGNLADAKSKRGTRPRAPTDLLVVTRFSSCA